MLGTSTAPATILLKRELVGSVGLVFLSKIILSTAFATKQSDQDSRCLFRFSHGGIITSRGVL